MTTETLEYEVAWEPSGHLSEVALSVMADGEDALLDAAMHAHLASCEACAMQLGSVALRAASVAGALSRAPAFAAEVRSSLPIAGEIQVIASVPAPVIVAQAIANEAALASLVDDGAAGRASAPSAPSPATARPASRRRRVPALPIAAAMAIALLGILPSLGRVRQQVSPLWSVLTDVAPALVKLGPQAFMKAWSGSQSARMVPLVWALAAVLVAAGLAIASRASKKMFVDGGRR